MEQSFKILICGMPRSMTTWIFNVVSEILTDYELKTMWIAAGDQESENAFSTSDGICLAKCHHFSKSLAESADLIIYSYRDIRTAAVSCYRKFNLSYSHDEITSWLDAQKQWVKYADIAIQYENVDNNKENVLVEIRNAIKNKNPHIRLHDDNGSILQEIEKKFESKQESDGVTYSPDNMVLPKHRTFQPDPESLIGMDKQIYQQVQAGFLPWLHQYGYITMDEYGQEIEFDIAAKILSFFVKPYVIDIGVERGSFIELAVKSGAGKVDGFEPLPRHLDYLHDKYRASDLVAINAYAVSNQSGESTFHVATDHDGNELDYHHTLSDLGDSATVNRSNKTIEVKTTTLNDFVNKQPITVHVDFLKIDTDGHDLNVLHGLSELRPTIIMAEYWDDLPETSGTNSYTLTDLTLWANDHGYSESIVVRRNGKMEMIERNTPWSISGDWGNVFFVHKDFDFENIKAFIDDLSRKSYSSVCIYTASFIMELEQKEAVIQGLSAELQAKNKQLEGKDKQLVELTGFINQSRLLKYIRHILESFYWLYHRIPGHYVVSKLFYRSRQVMRPRLGDLAQYSHMPRDLTQTQVIELPENSVIPKLSIVTPSFGQAAFIERTINSILTQNYPNLEYFVQDGGSTDGTIDVLKKFENQLSGWKSESDSGQSQAINRGFSQTSGDIMAWLNSDDLLLSGAINRVIDYFNRHPEVDVVYGNRLMIDEQDMEIGRWILPCHSDKAIAWADYIPQETLFWRRSIWDKAGGQIDESFRFAMDWDLLLRFRAAGAKFAHIPHFLGAFRIHEAQKTSAIIHEIGTQEMDRIRNREHGYVANRDEVRKKVLPFLLRHIITDLGYRIKTRLGFKVN